MNPPDGRDDGTEQNHFRCLSKANAHRIAAAIRRNIMAEIIVVRSVGMIPSNLFRQEDILGLLVVDAVVVGYVSSEDDSCCYWKPLCWLQL